MTKDKRRSPAKGNAKKTKKQPMQITWETARLYVIFLGIIVALAFVITLSLHAFVYGGHVVVMYVDGHPVTRDEFVFHMRQERPNVSNYFFMHHNTDLNRESWTQEYGGARPDDMLRQRAAHSVTETKTIQILALENGISDDISYQAMQRERLQLNRERRTAFEAGEVLYGVVEFVPMTHYLQVMSNFRGRVHEVLASEYVFVTEQQLRDFYQEHYDFYNTDGNITIAELFIPYMAPGREPTTMVQRTFEEAWELISDIYGRLQNGAEFNELATTYMGEPPFEGVLAAESGRGRMVGSQSRLVQAASGLSDGEFTQPFENGFGFSILKIIDSATMVSTPFEEAIQYMYPIIMEQSVEEFLRQRAEHAEVVIRDFVFHRVRVPRHGH